MYSVSSNFKTAMESNIKNLAVRIKYKDNSENVVTLLGNDAIVSVKISSECELGSSAVRKAEIVLLQSKLPDSFYELNVDQYFTIEYGVLTISTPVSWEYVYIGAFRITDFNEKEEDKTVNIVAYDRMYDTMVNYVEKMPVESFWTANTTLAQYISNVLSKCSITLGNTDFVHNGMKITSDRFVSKGTSSGYVSNIFGYTVRDLINNICQISGTVAIISPYNNSEDRLYFKKLNVNTVNYTISSINSLISFKNSDEYGEISKVIFAREPQQDYIQKIHSDMTDEKDLVEWKVDNNQLVDWQPIINPSDPTLKAPEDKRSTYIDPTFYAICGEATPPHSGAIWYYPFDAETIGYGWFEIGDRILIADVESFILGYSVAFDGGIQETISARKTNKTDTKVKFISNKDQNQTQLVVDKQNQIIKSYVQQTKDNTDSITQLNVSDTNVKILLTKSSGENLIRNSVMYNNYIDNNSVFQAKEWIRSNTGTFSTKYIGKTRCASGREFTLDNEKVYQNITVEPNKSCSMFLSFKKNSGDCYAKIYDDVKVYVLKTIYAGSTDEFLPAFWDNFVPLSNNVKVELNGDPNTNFTVTDLIISKGEVHKPWSLGSGEITNDSVLIDNSGINVSGDGSYSTSISATEFVGRQNGEIIFSLNNQTTVVNKLKSTTEIDMPPLKIITVPNGWAIVRSE